MFLQPTIDSLIEKAEGEIEIIAVIDGDWPKIPIKDDSHVILIHHGRRGAFNAISEAARIAQGKYIMKCDAHCLFDKGFDVKLAADCEPNWLSVPTRYSLDPEKWKRKPDKKVINAMYICVPNEKPEGEKFWEVGFSGVVWKGYEEKRNRKDILIDDLMTFQGSCWFMHRDYYFKINCNDEKVNETFTFGREAQDLGCKVWLSDGRVIRNKKTWYAHWHKGKEYGRGYYLSRKRLQRRHEFIVDYWMNNKWPGQKKKIKWLIDKFAPVPGWEDFNWTS